VDAAAGGGIRSSYAAGPWQHQAEQGGVKGEAAQGLRLPPGLLVLPLAPTPAGGEQQQQQSAAAHPPQQQQEQHHHKQRLLQQQWQQLPLDLQRGAWLASELRRAAQERLGLTLSCGVARNKLLARLASPLGKPDGLAVVPDSGVLPFIRGVPLQKVPYLRWVRGWAAWLRLACFVWDGLGWDGMGWDGMGWDGQQPGVGPEFGRGGLGWQVRVGLDICYM